MLSRIIGSKSLGVCGVAMMVGCGFSTTGFAQSSPPVALTVTVLMDEIIVTGTRTQKTLFASPLSEAIVTPEEISRGTSESIAEFVQDIPGLQIDDGSFAGFQRVTIRGEDARRVQILIDGQEVSDQRQEGPPILIDAALIERIEVIRGPASVLHGSKAVGGVINIITKKGGDRPLQGTVGSSYDSSTNGYHPTVSIYGSTGDLSYRLFGSLARHNDRETPEGKLDNSSFETDSLYAWLGYETGDHKISATLDTFRIDAESHSPRRLFKPPLTVFQLDMPQRDRRKAALFYDLADVSDSITNIHIDIFDQTIKRHFVQDIVNSIPVGPNVMNVGAFIDTRDDLHSTGANLQVDWQATADHFVIFGGQAIYDQVDQVQDRISSNSFPVPTSTSFQFTNEMEQRLFAAFVQDDWTISEDWLATAGARYTWVTSELERSNHLTPFDSSDGKLVGSLSLVYTGVTDTSLRASWSQGYVYPTLLFLASGTGQGGGRITHGNPGLNPETSNNYEIGVRYDNDTIMLDATVYYTAAKDYITTARCSGAGTPIAPCTGSRDSYYTNADEARTRGIEVYAEYDIDSLDLTPYLKASALRRNIDFGTFTTSKTAHPRLSTTFGLRYETDLPEGLGPMSGAPFWANGYVRAVTDTDEERSAGVIDHYPGYGVFNLSFGAAFGDDEGTRVAVDLVNLTDKSYEPAKEGNWQAERSIVVKLEVDF